MPDARANGTLIIIGGHEDKDAERTILNEVAQRVGDGRLVIATIASYRPEGSFDIYRAAFAALGITDLVELYIDNRREASGDRAAALLDDAAAVFFTGGDQLRIASQIGATPLERAVRGIRDRGGLVAGTSAGASVMSETMLVGGPGNGSPRTNGARMAPGLGLIRDVIIDQHFAERGRIGRLLGAVAQNPRLLGIGIDEDTAIIVADDAFTVVGSGAVTIVDGAEVSWSSIAEARPEPMLSIHDVRLHLLSTGDRFDLARRRPVRRVAAPA